MKTFKFLGLLLFGTVQLLARDLTIVNKTSKEIVLVLVSDGPAAHKYPVGTIAPKSTKSFSDLPNSNMHLQMNPVSVTNDEKRSGGWHVPAASVGLYETSDRNRPITITVTRTFLDRKARKIQFEWSEPSI